MKNHLYSSTPVCLILLELWGALAAPCRWEDGCVCAICPAGQEPTACGEVEGPGVTGLCRTCPAGTFSDSHDAEPCRPPTSCSDLNRWVLTEPTSLSDAVCGGCLPGFNPAATRKSLVLHACVRKPHSRRRRNVGKSKSGVGGLNSTVPHSPEEKTTEYAVFALVPIFCVMGLLGIFICNLLKKKGFRCNADKDGMDEESATPQKEGNLCPYIVDNPNEDTISILVRLITEKKENAAALEELLLEYDNKQKALNKTSSIKIPALPNFSQFRSLPRLCSHQHHLHTINGLAPRSGLYCSRCSQKKWPELLLPAMPLPTDKHKYPADLVKTTLPEDVTILSVGRFQVAQIPEMKSSCKDVTQTESSDTDSVDSVHTEPAEERSLLGVSSNSASSKCRQDINI